MKAIILPGNNSENRDWLPLVAEVLRRKNFEPIELAYEHWQTGGELIDFEKETKRLAAIAKDIGPFIVIGKSAGVMLCLKAVAESLIKPERAIFFGCPITWARHLKLPFDEWLEKWATPTLFVQQSNDLAGSATEVFAYLKTKVNSQCSFREIPGNDHWYGEAELLSVISNF